MNYYIPINHLFTLLLEKKIVEWIAGASYLDNRRSQSSLICVCANQMVRIVCSEL